MIELTNLEYYTTPDGAVMVKPHEGAVRKLEVDDRLLVESMFIVIRDDFPIAFKTLSDMYSKSEANRHYFEYLIVHRFCRCNFGEYDGHSLDIDRHGFFHFEEVKCPLRGECKHEGVICKPQIDSRLSPRQIEVLALIADGLQASEISDELNISISTVDRHREDIKRKLNIKTIVGLSKYYHTYMKK